MSAKPSLRKRAVVPDIVATRVVNAVLLQRRLADLTSEDYATAIRYLHECNEAQARIIKGLQQGLLQDQQKGKRHALSSRT